MINLLRKLLVLGIIVISMTSLAVAAPIAKISNERTEIGVMTQEYIDNNIAEILMIYYDGSQAALQEYGGRNPEIEALNNAIKFGIQQRYNEFMDTKGEEWIEIRSYPFSDTDYLQIVMTSSIYPSYGTDGELWSYNFNKVDNQFMLLSDELDELNLTAAGLRQAVTQLYVPEAAGMTLGSVQAVGFLRQADPSGHYFTQLLLEVVIENPAAESWKRFFIYTPKFNELIELNRYCLFDPYSMDQMDPPLMYQRPEAQ